MTIRISSREFNQNLSRAKRDAASGPVLITDRGTPSHVLLSYSDYARITAQRPNIVQALAMQTGDDALDNIEFEPEKSEINARLNDLF